MIRISEELLVDSPATETNESFYSSAKFRSSQQQHDDDLEWGRYENSYTPKKINLNKPLEIRDTSEEVRKLKAFDMQGKDFTSMHHHH